MSHFVNTQSFTNILYSIKENNPIAMENISYFSSEDSQLMILLDSLNRYKISKNIWIFYQKLDPSQ